MQNRVDPFGNIIDTKVRGTWLGNRGQLHGRGKTILRPFKNKAWIICVLQFKGRHRQIMAPNLWTELFFLDEATAFAAGHRPCFECRREDALRFKEAWTKGNPEFGFDMKTRIGKIDEVLHNERIDAEKQKVTYTSAIKNLPEGAFIEIKNKPYLVNNNQIYPWAPEGYGEAQSISTETIVTVLTPLSILNAFRAGYKPQIACYH